MPLFSLFVLGELLVLLLKGKHVSLADSFTSASQGTLRVASNAVVRVFGFTAYCWLYDQVCVPVVGRSLAYVVCSVDVHPSDRCSHAQIHIVDLPWDSLWCWFLALVVVDFGYYVFHRAAHEINLLWLVCAVLRLISIQGVPRGAPQLAVLQSLDSPSTICPPEVHRLYLLPTLCLVLASDRFRCSRPFEFFVSILDPH